MAQKEKKGKPVKGADFDGDTWYTCKEIGEFTGRTVKSVYDLIKKGNQWGKLPCRYIGGRPMVPKTELLKFVFVSSGRYGAMQSYRYTANGEKDYDTGFEPTNRPDRKGILDADSK